MNILITTSIYGMSKIFGNECPHIDLYMKQTTFLRKMKDNIISLHRSKLNHVLGLYGGFMLKR